ncbi:hypothetical protein [Actinomadura sp. NAK00032]|nr:hypothetical protein [Actinomadura sp. NAK00032]
MHAVETAGCTQVFADKKSGRTPSGPSCAPTLWDPGRAT